MIVEERYGNPCNAEEFAVEVKRGQLYCNPERVNILYLIGRARYVNWKGQMVYTSEILRREAFSASMLERFLDEKDRLKDEQMAINMKVAQLAEHMGDYAESRRIRIENGWAMKEADEA